MLLLLQLLTIAHCFNGTLENEIKIYKPSGLYEELPVAEQLLENYDRRVRPGYGTPKPVDIYVNIFVNSFGAVSAETMDYKVSQFLISGHAISSVSTTSANPTKSLFTHVLSK